MFALDTTIDAVQTGKKTMVNAFVTNEAIKESMIKFIDTQSDYTKKAAKVGLDTYTTVTSEAMKQAEAFAKFDWIKATQSTLDAIKPKTK